MRIKQRIKKICPKPIWNIMAWFKKNKYKSCKLKELKQKGLVHKSGGMLNKSKKFLIITDNADAVGLLTGWMHYMTLVHFAIENAYIPVIDFKNYKMGFCQDEDFSKINSWDLYFTQPFPEYNLDDVYRSKNYYIACYKEVMHSYGDVLCDYSLYRNSNNDFPELISKDDLILNRFYYSKCSLSIAIRERAIKEKECLFPRGEKVLGVSVRHMFSWHHAIKSTITPDGTHPEKGTLDEIIQNIKNGLSKTGYKYFFLSVDERFAWSRITEEFGKKCITIKRMLPHPFDEKGEPRKYKNIGDEIYREMYIEFKGEPRKFMKKNSTDYLTEVCLLSMCDSLVSYGGSAAVFAYIINDKYEYVL